MVCLENSWDQGGGNNVLQDRVTCATDTWLTGHAAEGTTLLQCEEGGSCLEAGKVRGGKVCWELTFLKVSSEGLELGVVSLKTRDFTTPAPVGLVGVKTCCGWR